MEWAECYVEMWDMDRGPAKEINLAELFLLKRN